MNIRKPLIQKCSTSMITLIKVVMTFNLNKLSFQKLQSFIIDECMENNIFDFNRLLILTQIIIKNFNVILLTCYHFKLYYFDQQNTDETVLVFI